MNISDMAQLAALALAALAAVGFFVLWSRERARAEGLAGELRAAEAGLARLEERAGMLSDTSAHVEAAFKAMSAEAMSHASQALLRQAEEHFVARDRIVQERLAVQLQPVAETLTKFEAQVAALEARRNEEQGGLKEQIAALMAASVSTQEEARKLSQALRRGAGVQGRWGEEMLRNVLELAGLTRGVDFHEQVSLDTPEGRVRPDVVVKMPGGGAFVIDAKVSLSAFLDAQAATDEAVREEALGRHLQSLRTHVQQLSGKSYFDALKISPDFVVMFVPGDGMLATAVERGGEIMQEAMGRRVIIATPSTLFALCKAVSYGWRVEAQAKNAEQVARLGKELHKRIADMAGHVGGVGKALETAVSRYNNFIGSLESRVLPAARQFETLKIDGGAKAIEDLGPIETAVKPLTRLAAQAEDATPTTEGPSLTLRNGEPNSSVQ